ncbi:MAG: hypothetical protein GKR94_04575 [Gammaproteobacteria bacterium]|nr:hypothetical protein [Gammaproteobacteria bacterium]
MLTDKQISKIATVANTLIDVPLVPEWMEQYMFEKAVGLINETLEEVLPLEMKGLLEDLNDETLILDRAHSGSFIERLVTAVDKRVDIPFLGEKQEEKLVRTVIELLVKAMSSAKSLDKILDRINA